MAAFVVVDGVAGAGKTTALKAFVEELLPWCTSHEAAPAGHLDIFFPLNMAET